MTKANLTIVRKIMTYANIRILLVDDERQFIDTLAQRLIMRGFSPRVVYSGEAALVALKEPTDIVLLDLRMTGMDGFEVLSTLTKCNPTIKIIILTGHGADAEEQTAYRMGAFNFLRKPVDIDELLQSIRMAVQEKTEEVCQD